MTINSSRIYFANMEDLLNNQEHKELRVGFRDPKTYQSNSVRQSRLSIYFKKPRQTKMVSCC